MNGLSRSLKVVFLMLILCLPQTVLGNMSGDAHKGHANHTEQQVEEDDDKTTWIEEKTGEYLPLDIEFKDSTGKVVTLGELIDKPTVLLPIYYYCPGVCTVNLSNLANSLNHLSFSPGIDYRVIALSFNDVETPDDAKRAKRNYLKLLKDDFPADQWSFLTGSEVNIKSVTDTLGYGFKKLPDGMFIHATVLAVVDREGQIIRYVYGKFLSGDIDIGISDALASKPASSVKRLLSYCINYRPNSDNSVFEIVKISILFIFVITLIVTVIFIKRKKNKIVSDHSTKNSTSQEE